MAATELGEVDVHLKSIISNLYVLILQAHNYEGAGTRHAMTEEIRALIKNLVQLSHSARRLPTHIPKTIVEYVEGARNPDVYTREFVEAVMKGNQQLKGRSEAFAQFRDILGREMMSAIPDIREDVKEIVEGTGGKVGV